MIFLKSLKSTRGCEMNSFIISNSDIKNNIFIPKYYDPSIEFDLESMLTTHKIFSIQHLIDSHIIEVSTGHEVGKMAYGTGNIPFIRTTDIYNWELKTIPKQGISEEYYVKYASKQDVQVGDILMVKDGDYLIGSTCMITKSDLPLVFQSHILKFRVLDQATLDPYLFFIILNSDIVQRQIRNVQFTADIIDTIGSRYLEVQIPIPKDLDYCSQMSSRVKSLFESRDSGKLAIKQLPSLVEEVLKTGTNDAIDSYFELSYDEKVTLSRWDTARDEFGKTTTFVIKKSLIENNIFLPKYYNPGLITELNGLIDHCILCTIQSLVDKGMIELQTGVEIGKECYGTGDVAFVRTSDFSNWELKTDPKQSVSENIYDEYSGKTDVIPGDILLVRDGSYLIGTTCLITSDDSKLLYCGGIYKIRVIDPSISPYLFLALLNSYIVKQQIRTKQFTRDVIDTIGKRILEVYIPIPKDRVICERISNTVNNIITQRIIDRNNIKQLTKDVELLK